MDNLYYFYGAEEFLIDQEIGELKAVRDVAVESLSPDNSQIMDVVSSIFTPSLFVSKRLFKLEGYSTEEYEVLLNSWKDVPEGTRVVIIDDKPDRRTKFFKKLSGMAVVKEFKPFAEWETDKAVTWIISRAKGLSRTIDRETAGILFEISGPSLRQIASELEKIATFCGDRKEITEKDVRELAVSGELSTFALENAFMARDLPQALYCLNNAIRLKERPEIMIGKLAGRVRLFIEIKCLLEQGMRKDQVISRLGMNPYYYERCEKAVKQYSLQELCRAVRTFHETDIELKTTGRSQRILLELMLIEIMSKTRDTDIAKN